jgi:hypothetical protein
MRTFEVTIKAVIRKTYRVEAEDEQQAQQQAHEQFSVLNEPGIDEHYSQDVIDIAERDS